MITSDSFSTYFLFYPKTLLFSNQAQLNKALGSNYQRKPCFEYFHLVLWNIFSWTCFNVSMNKTVRNVESNKIWSIAYNRLNRHRGVFEGGGLIWFYDHLMITYCENIYLIMQMMISWVGGKENQILPKWW